LSTDNRILVIIASHSPKYAYAVCDISFYNFTVKDLISNVSRIKHLIWMEFLAGLKIVCS